MYELDPDVPEGVIPQSQPCFRRAIHYTPLGLKRTFTKKGGNWNFLARMKIQKTLQEVNIEWLLSIQSKSCTMATILIVLGFVLSFSWWSRSIWFHYYINLLWFSEYYNCSANPYFSKIKFWSSLTSKADNLIEYVQTSNVIYMPRHEAIANYVIIAHTLISFLKGNNPLMINS